MHLFFQASSSSTLRVNQLHPLVANPPEKVGKNQNILFIIASHLNLKIEFVIKENKERGRMDIHSLLLNLI